MPDAVIFIEKRNNPYLFLKLPLKYWVIEDSNEIKWVREKDKNKRISHAFNLSLRGLYLVSNIVLEVGNTLRLMMKLPENSREMMVYAEVVWTNETGGGIKFKFIKEEDLDALNNCLSRAHQKV